MREEAAFSEEPASLVRSPQIALPAERARIPILDGWRAISILLVLAAHLLPLGPSTLQLNALAGAAGMALFFTLSGFLVTQFLANGMPIDQFMARRLARILPLGWAAMTVLTVWHPRDTVTIVRNFLFIANLPPASLLQDGEHLWSLCVEMQFYVSIGLLCLIFSRKSLYLVPALALVVTGARIAASQPISIVTWHRVDEILAGGMIALIYVGWFGKRSADLLARIPVWPLAIALLVCSHPGAGPLQYLRPYAASFLVGSSLANCPARLERFLASKPMAYIAEISYALYVVHAPLSGTWLGTGNKAARYAKRPLLFAASFLLAHISTRYFEQPITRRVRQLSKQRSLKRITVASG